MTIRYGDHFLKSAKNLPKVQRQKLARLLELVESNPYHPLLHTKPLTGELAGLYAFRITRDWRVIFRFDSAIEIVLVDIGNRKDIYR